MKCLNCRKQEILIDTEICPGCNAYLATLMTDVLKQDVSLHHNSYRIEYILGRGGFGVTYKAKHINLDEEVAIKEFYPSKLAARNMKTNTLTVVKQEEETYQRNLERFKREGKVLAKLRHPSIVGVRDLFEENNTAYLVMELLEGETLQDELNKTNNVLKEKQIISIFNKLVSALDIIHQKGIYHLDIKPDNIMITKDQRVVLIDFGSAKQQVIGINSSTRSYTEGYAPPELISNRKDVSVGVESDIFELGMMLYELLTGKRLPNTIDRLLEGATSWKVDNVDSKWKMLIEQAIILKKEERPKSVKEWWEQISNKSKSIVNQVTHNTQQQSNFEYETVKVDKKGEIIERVKKQANQFIEGIGKGIILEMVEIPSGEFMMGSTERTRYKDEKPQHKVRVPAFYMGKYQVTQEQWKAVMESNPSRFKGSGKLPVEKVSWNDAVEFCKRLSEKTNKIYRLASEAEWEYVCRAGTETPFAYGETINTDIVNYDGDYPYGEGAKGIYRKKTTVVGSLGVANEFGLYDMHGNVLEWCQDEWHSNYEGAPIDGSAWEKQKADNSNRVVRGGSWVNVANYCRSAVRSWYAPGYQLGNLGLRVVLVAMSL